MRTISFLFIIFFILFLFLITSIIVNAGAYGTKTYSEGPYVAVEPQPSSPAPAISGGATSGGGGTGGGGGGISLLPPLIINFSIDKNIIKVALKQGETKKEALRITNTGTSIFDLSANLRGIAKFKVSPEASEITATLSPNEEKVIELVLKASEDEKPEIYTSEILLKGPSMEKEVLTVIEVDSAQPAFDVNVGVLAGSKKILPGQELLFEINLINVRGSRRVNASVEYSIKDFKENVIAAEHETLAVETQAKFTRYILVPTDLNPGTYVVAVKVAYGDSVGTSSDLFEVTAKSIKLYPVQIKDYKSILLFGAITLIFSIFIFSAFQYGHFKKKIPKTEVEEIKEVKQLKEEEKVQKLKKELEALKDAYKSKFISEESYQKDKKRIEKKLNLFKYK